MIDVYGENQAGEITAGCRTKGFLGNDSPVTTRWQSECTGQKEVIETSTTRGENGSSVSEHPVLKDALLTAYWLGLPLTDIHNKLQGSFKSPHIGTWTNQFDPFASLTADAPEDEVTGSFVPWRPEERERLPGFTEADLVRLGLDPALLTPVKKDPPKGPPPPPPPEQREEKVDRRVRYQRRIAQDAARPQA